MAYRASFGATTLFAGRDALTFTLQEALDHEAMHGHGEVLRKGHAWRMTFVGAAEPVMTEVGPSSYYYNYFLGNDPAHWAGEVRPFTEVTYKALWPGVDLRLHSEKGDFKYDVLARSAADLLAVAFSYDGTDGMKVDDQGRLVITTSLGDVMELAPVAWYADGAQEPVRCTYQLDGRALRFKLGAGVDPARPLVIDPTLVAATLSGTGDIDGMQNFGHCATYDAAGNIYTGAKSYGPGYPVTLGAFQGTHGGIHDMAISKLSPDGSSLIWATYLGGEEVDRPHSLIVNAANELFVLGSSESTDYPTTGSAFQPSHADAAGTVDIVITHLNAAGSGLIGSTFMGGPGEDGYNGIVENYGDNYRGEIVLDGAGNCLVASSSSSNAFPITAGAIQGSFDGVQDGVFFSLDAALSNLLFSTYVGGPQRDMLYGVKSDGAGGYFVCGVGSDGIPVTPVAFGPAPIGSLDAFLLHVNGDATAVLQGTYFGTPENDQAFFVDTDEDGNVFIYGNSAGDVPIQPAGTFGQPGSLFVAKFTSDLSTVLMSTEIGNGSGFEDYAPIAFLVDVCGNVYLSAHDGTFFSTVHDMPLSADAFQTEGGFYLAVFDPTMTSLIFGSCYGGADDHVDGGTSRFDEAGIVYQAVCSNTGFNTTPGAFSNTYPEGYDIGVFKIDFELNVLIANATASPMQGCAPLEVTFTNTSTGSNAWTWNFDDGSPEESVSGPVHTFTDPGVYDVRLIANGPSSCAEADTFFVQITVSSPEPIEASFLAEPAPDCTALQVTVTNTSSANASQLNWLMGDGTELTGATLTHTYAVPGTYTIRLIASDPAACTVADTAFVEVEIDAIENIEAAFELEEIPGCAEVTITATATATWPTATYTWVLEDGSEQAGTSLAHTIQGAGSYTISLIAADAGACNQADTVTTTIVVPPLSPIDASFTVEEEGGCGSLTVTTTNTSTGGAMEHAWELSDGAAFGTEDITHTFNGAGAYTITLTVSDPAGCVPTSEAMVTVTVTEPLPVEAVLSAVQSGDCAELLVALEDGSVGDGLGLTLDLGDGTVLDAIPPTYAYTAPGTYTITLTVTDALCDTQDQQAVEVTMIASLPASIVGDTVLCPGGQLVLQGLAEGALLWSTGAITPTITVSEPGSYTVVATMASCVGSATVEVTLAPPVPEGQRIESCPGIPVTLRIPVDQARSYQWTDGDTQQEWVIPAVTGTFPYTGIDRHGCAFAGLAVVETLDPEAYVYVPNAFSPNGDGRNDAFAAVGEDLALLELSVFDRWGEQVFASTASPMAWDGIYKGKEAKSDVYVFRLRYASRCEPGTTERFGHVTLLR